MFENLTQRERTLALSVLALVPITLLFLGVMSFINAYKTNMSEEFMLADQIKTERQKMLDGVNAGKRQNYYASLSLPQDLTSASNEYQQWLKKVAQEVQLEVTSVKPSGDGQISLKPGQPPIAKTKSLAVQVSGELQQLNEFLSRFYEVDLLHRIDTLRIVPMTEGTGAKKTRNGQLKIFLSIKIMSLMQAEDRENFTQQVMDRNREQYVQILKRNVFGPANNAPIVRARSSSYTTGNKGAFDITADDADKRDLLTFELIESSVEAATLNQSRPNDRRARFSVPSQEPGTYEFKVKVSDNGFPAKESIETFAVTFREKPTPPEPPATKPPPPKYKHALQTRVTGIARNRDGDWQAWIFDRLGNHRYKLKTGETFELDEMTWEVKRINEDEVFLEAGGKRYVARPNPVERGKLIEIPDADTTTSKESETGTALD